MDPMGTRIFFHNENFDDLKLKKRELTPENRSWVGSDDNLL